MKPVRPRPTARRIWRRWSPVHGKSARAGSRRGRRSGHRRRRSSTALVERGIGAEHSRSSPISEDSPMPMRDSSLCGRANSWARPSAQMRWRKSSAKVAASGRAAHRQADQPGDHREDILDAVAQFAAQHLSLFGLPLGVVDVGAGADPAHDRARRRRAAEARGRSSSDSRRCGGEGDIRLHRVRRWQGCGATLPTRVPGRRGGTCRSTPRRRSTRRACP